MKITRRTLFGSALAAFEPPSPTKLIARWKVSHGAHMEVPDRPSLRFGTGEFSASLWLNVDLDPNDQPGGILSKYDPAARRGFLLSLATNRVNTAQANLRNFHFGIDNARAEAEWQDCGRPGKAALVFALCVHDGALYAATCEPGAGESGHVYRYAGGREWVDCGAPDGANSVPALASLDGALYAGTARYNTQGSALPASPNETPGGRVFRYEGGQRWVDCGKLGASAAVYSLVSYRGKLHGSSMYAPAGTFRYEGGRTWKPCGTPGGKRVNGLTVYRGDLYGGSFDGAFVWQYKGESEWAGAGEMPDNTQTYGFATYRGSLHVGTWPSGKVYRQAPGGAWLDCGRLGAEKEVMGMIVYNGQFYAGTLPLAQVYRYEADQKWTLMKRLDTTPDVTYRRVWSMAVFGGRLYCGTLPSGHVYSWEAGKNATCDHALGRGWHHVAAIRARDRLKLYVDGRLASTSSEFRAADYDLSNTQPLLIGSGMEDSFRGELCDVRLYRGALSQRDIADLAARRECGG